MIDSKACTKCGVVKPLDDFYKSKKIKSGYVGMCKECDNAKGRAYYASNADKVNARVNAARKANPEKKKAQDKSWYENNKEANYARGKAWRLANPERARAIQKAWATNNPDAARERNRRRLKTVRGKLENAVRAGFHKGITSDAKAGRKTFELLGYTVTELKEHLERQFQPGMSWDNHGRGEGCWHIDHIIPISAHNFTTPDDIDFKRAWALSNLRPLWESDNLSKSAKLESPFQPSFAFGAANDNGSQKEQKHERAA